VGLNRFRLLVRDRYRASENPSSAAECRNAFDLALVTLHVTISVSTSRACVTGINQSFAHTLDAIFSSSQAKSIRDHRGARSRLSLRLRYLDIERC
jgi:hypothetical protein